MIRYLRNYEISTQPTMKLKFILSRNNNDKSKLHIKSYSLEV